jgi:hypothetical protein
MLIKFDKTMRKSIQIEEEVLVRLVEGKCVEGSLRRDKWTGQLTFRAYNRQPQIRKKDKLIRSMEHGWVKESVARYKYYESIPKKVGMASVISILERDTKVAKEALIDRELINRV